MMDSTFKVKHLLLPDLNYELRIRDTFTEKSLDEKRKILGRLVAKERQQSFDVLTLKDKKFDFYIEKSEIETTLNSIENLVNDFEGTSTDSTFLTANPRLIHILLRINILKFKQEAFATALTIEADLYDHVRESDPNVQMNSSVNDPNAKSAFHQNVFANVSPRNLV